VEQVKRWDVADSELKVIADRISARLALEDAEDASNAEDAEDTKDPEPGFDGSSSKHRNWRP
jgi:hypothetical protein